MAVTKGSFPITRLSQNAGWIDSGIFSNWALWTYHSPTLPSSIFDSKVARFMVI
jgi:hypothetical protein